MSMTPAAPPGGPYIVTDRAEAAALIAAGFSYETLSEDPLRLQFPEEARSAGSRRRQWIEIGRQYGRGEKLEKRFLRKSIRDRL